MAQYTPKLQIPTPITLPPPPELIFPESVSPSVQTISSEQITPENGINIYSILGVIKKSEPLKYDKGNLFTVISSTSSREYRIVCTYFCPARRGDVLSGYCINHESQNGWLQLVREPVVEPASSKEAIQSTFVIYLAKTRFRKALSDKLYRFFEEQALRMISEASQRRVTSEDEESPILRNRDLLSSAVMEVISLYARRFRTCPEVIEPLIELGLSEEQAKKLLNGWYKSFSLRRLYLLGLTKREIRESCERGWTPDTLYYQLLENPYLTERVPYEKAEIIARKYQLSFNQNMLESAQLVRFVDKQTQERGWACHPVFGLMKRFPRFKEFQDTLKRSYHCRIRYNFFYLKHQAQVEDTLTQLLTSEELISTYCSERTRETLCEEQIEAVETALNYRVSVITGGAGVGKTTVIAALCDEFELLNRDYLVASFTGKAVARIKEVVKRTDKVMTLHMILAKGNLPKVDTLIIDEISMVPNQLLARVLIRLLEVSETHSLDILRDRMEARTEPLRIVLVGDSQQVQPIEWGDLFNQILTSGQLPTTFLTQDHRRKERGVLYSNMQKFGNPDEIEFEWGSDCMFESGTIPEVISLAKNMFASGVDHTEITIICPFGDKLEEINRQCQAIFIDPSSPMLIDAFGNPWKVGARVMMTTNRYDINVMNGEEGIVTGVFPENNQIAVKFRNGEEVRLPSFVPVVIGEQKNWDEEDQPLSTKLLVLSWAITIHKSQGSEWKRVILYLPENRGPAGFLNRKLLYTGISRAKECLHVVGKSELSFMGIIGIDPPSRYDNLGRRLQGEKYVDHYVDPAQVKMNKLLQSS